MHCSKVKTNHKTQEGIVLPNPPSNTNYNVFDDLDILIALKKGTRSCTMHPISKYVWYHRSSNSFRAFTTSMSYLEIPKSVEDALAFAK